MPVSSVNMDTPNQAGSNLPSQETTTSFSQAVTQIGSDEGTKPAAVSKTGGTVNPAPTTGPTPKQAGGPAPVPATATGSNNASAMSETTGTGQPTAKGSGGVSDLYAPPIVPQTPKEPPPAPLPSGGPNPSVTSILEGSSYDSGAALQKWAGIANADPGSLGATALEQELNLPIAAAQALADNWSAWGLGKNLNVSELSNPLSSLPPQAQAILKWIGQNPAMQTALDYANDPGGKTDGIIQQADVEKFVATATADAESASKAVTAWMDKNPNAGAQSTALVQSAGIVMANEALASAADSAHQSGKEGNDGVITGQGLSALSNDNPSLGYDLAGAAALWSQPGMFQVLSNAGEDPAYNQPEGKADAANFSGFISEAPTNDVDFANLLNQAAVQSTVAGISTANIGSDVFTDPSKYTGAQKAAVLEQLSNLYNQVSAAGSDGIWNSGFSESNLGINVNTSASAVLSDIAQKMSVLQSDPDVQAFFAKTLPAAQQAIANSDDKVSGAMQDFFQSSIETGKALTTDLAQKDDSGNQVDPATGLESFVQQVSFYDGVLGTGGDTLGLTNPQGTNSSGATTVPSWLQVFVANSGQEGMLESYFTNNIENTALLTNAISGGTDVTTAVNQFSSALATFSTALDPAFIAQNAQTTQTNLANNTSTAILAGASESELNSAFGSDSQINAIVQQLQQADPSMFKNSDGSTVTPAELVSLVKETTDLVRNGVKIQDALSKVVDGITKPSGAAADAYSTGALHLLSAVLAGGVLAAKAAEGAGSPTADASIAASAAQGLGTFTEAFSKFNTSQVKGLTASAEYKAQLTGFFKNLEASGKVLGGLGGALGGALGIASGLGDLQSGQLVEGGLNIGSGAAGLTAGVAGGVEGGTGLLAQAGLISSDVADVAAAVSAVAGGASTVVGLFTGLGLAIYQTVQAAQQVNEFDQEVGPVFSQYGITGGPEGVVPPGTPPASQPGLDHGMGSLTPPSS